MKLFDRRYVYPRDETGPYVEVEGPVTAVGEPFDDSVKVTIRIEAGLSEEDLEKNRGEEISGWAEGPMARGAATARWARIRAYDSGGGFYPDNRVVGAGSERPGRGDSAG